MSATTNNSNSTHWSNHTFRATGVVSVENRPTNKQYAGSVEKDRAQSATKPNRIEMKIFITEFCYKFK